MTDLAVIPNPLEKLLKPSTLVSNLNKLPLGSILSYKEICCILEEPEVAGNSRVRQAEEWSSYMVLEKVGRKFLIKQIFSPHERGIEHLFNKDDTHIINSALLLQDYLLMRSEKCSAEDTEFEGVQAVTLYTKDLAMICGYVPKSYYAYRMALQSGNVRCNVAPLLQIHLTSIVRSEFGNLLRKLLASLKKKLLIVVREIYVGVKSMSQEELSDAQVAKFNSVKLAYASKTGQKNLQRLNTNTKEFRAMLKEAGLDFINVFTAYRITYTEKDLRKSLELEARRASVDSNNSHFKTRVREVAEKDNKKAWHGKMASNTQFLQDAFYSTESMNEIDWMLEEFLTYGTCSNWGEEDTTSL
jgi:hypothetical protein